MDSILDLIKKIEVRPTMYIGKSDIFCLRAYLDGWMQRNPETILDLPMFESFQDYIATKYKNDTHSWDAIIAFYSIDYKGELPLFFENFNEFIQRNLAISSPANR